MDYSACLWKLAVFIVCFALLCSLFLPSFVVCSNAFAFLFACLRAPSRLSFFQSVSLPLKIAVLLGSISFSTHQGLFVDGKVEDSERYLLFLSNSTLSDWTDSWDLFQSLCLEALANHGDVIVWTFPIKIGYPIPLWEGWSVGGQKCGQGCSWINIKEGGFSSTRVVDRWFTKALWLYEPPPHETQSS